MKRFFHSMFIYSRNICFRYFMPCALVAICCILISLLIKRKKENSTEKFGQYILNSINKRLIAIFISSTYLLLPLWSAVIIRFREPKQDPFENIWGGWGFVNWEYIYDFRLLYNVMMFSPIFLVLMLVFKYIINKKIEYKSLVLLSAIISFLYSVIIELLQIAFKVGTFQVSDLVYNTLGAIIGAVITILIIKRYKQKQA